MMKRPLTEQERKDLRVLIDILYQLTDKVKDPKSKLTSEDLHGGFLPFLFLLANLAARAIPIAIQAARVAIPALVRTGASALGRAVPTLARGATQLSRNASSVARGVRGAITRPARSATRPTGRTLAGTSTRKGLLDKVGTAATISGATGVIDMATGNENFDLPPEEQFPVYRDTPFPTYAHEDGDVPQRESAPEVDIPFGEPEAQEDTTTNLAPLRFTPAVRNVFTAAQSRNPLSSALQTSTLTATPASQPVRARDIGVFRGSGVVRRKRVMKKYGLEDRGYSLDELAKITGVPKETLQEVYNRGIGAYKTNPRSVRMKVSFEKNVDAPMSKKLSKEQWAMARVYSFLDGNPKHDTDLRPIEIPKKEFVKEHTELVDILTKGSKKERLAEARKQKKELAGKE